MNFTLVDTLGILKACFALAPILFAPGYLAGWSFNLFGFRQRRPVLQLALAVPLSIAISPIVSYLVARFLAPALWIFYAIAVIGCLLLLIGQVRKAKPYAISHHIWIAFAVCGIWVAVAIGCLVDLQIRHALYSPLAAYDHSTRVAMTAAVVRHVPPSNPFFAHPAVPLRYHYFWVLLCSLPLKVFDISARHLMYAGVVWCGIGLICTIALGLKFLVRTQTAIARKTLIGCALLGVTGLDILPTLYVAASQRTWLADMEWWNQVPITSWAASLLWVPHHVAALIACVVGFVLLRHDAVTTPKPIVPVLIAGVAFASAAGMSVYVTFTFAVAAGLWLLALVASKNWNEAAIFAGVGCVAAILAIAYLVNLSGPASGNGFIGLGFRPFALHLHFAQQIGVNIQAAPAVMLANAIALPVNYAIELGVFFMIAVLRLRQVLRRTVPATPDEIAAWTLVMASFLIGTFLQSQTIATNDLGIRCFLPAQFVLLLWAAIFIDDTWFATAGGKTATRRTVVPALALLLVLGVCGTLYELFMVRMSPVLYDRWGVAGLDWMDPDSQLGKRTYALRSVYESLNAQLPSSAVIQYNPATRNYVVDALYSFHDAAAGGMDCGAAFGGDPELCKQRVRRLVSVFQNREDVERACRDYGIDVFVAKDTDPGWRDRSSWIWNQAPMLGNDYVRAFRCSSLAANVAR